MKSIGGSNVGVCMNIYGVCSPKHSKGKIDFGYKDVSSDLRTAKMYAAKHGFTAVYRRSTDDCYIEKVAVRVGNKWVAVQGCI